MQSTTTTTTSSSTEPELWAFDRFYTVHEHSSTQSRLPATDALLPLTDSSTNTRGHLTAALAAQLDAKPDWDATIIVVDFPGVEYVPPPTIRITKRAKAVYKRAPFVMNPDAMEFCPIFSVAVGKEFEEEWEEASSGVTLVDLEMERCPSLDWSSTFSFAASASADYAKSTAPTTPAEREPADPEIANWDDFNALTSTDGDDKTLDILPSIAGLDARHLDMLLGSLTGGSWAK